MIINLKILIFFYYLMINLEQSEYISTIAFVVVDIILKTVQKPNTTYTVIFLNERVVRYITSKLLISGWPKTYFCVRKVGPSTLNDPQKSLYGIEKVVCNFILIV